MWNQKVAFSSLYSCRTEPDEQFFPLYGTDHDAPLDEFAMNVYHGVWTEFYDWEEIDCSQLIASLSSSEIEVGAPWHGLIPQYGNRLKREPDGTGLQTEDTLASVSIITWDSDGHFSQTQTCFETAITEPFHISPHPAYQSCTPTASNILPNSEVVNETMLRFIPYIDEEGFPAEEFAAKFYFAWQMDFEDPDVEVIQLEAARRLVFAHGFSFEAIDKISSKLLRKLRISNESGLLWETSQRDILRWPGDLSSLDHLPQLFPCAADDLKSRLNYHLRMFCPMLGCLQPMCSTHDVGYSGIDLDTVTVKPKVTNTRLILSEGAPCGDYCFRYITDAYMDTVHWDNTSDIETFQTILKVMPDLYPCELAVICQKPCREVFAQRSRLILDEHISDVDNDSQNGLKARAGPWNDVRNLEFTPLAPCNHKGPCGVHTHCDCWTERQHCQRNCRCSSQCELRWKGCNCHSSSKACTTEKCTCLRAGRECDPELCHSCGARDRSRSGCQNVKIQRGDFHPMEIKRGAFGLGAFATYQINPKDLIGEYCGELLAGNIADRQSLIRDHLNLNYLFELNKEYNLDAIDTGNPTRFINHATQPENNCDATVKLVNGSHRIGIFATKKIKPGKEIFLDYGANYWNRHASSDIFA